MVVLALDRATPATSPRNHTHVLVHWKSYLQGFQTSATEPALADSDNRDRGSEQPLRLDSIGPGRMASKLDKTVRTKEGSCILFCPFCKCVRRDLLGHVAKPVSVAGTKCRHHTQSQLDQNRGADEGSCTILLSICANRELLDSEG